jgi:hypothetical protein
MAVTNVTASSGARIKAGTEKDVQNLLDKYDFSNGLDCRINNGRIEMYGYALLDTRLKEEEAGVERDCGDYMLDFLEELAPFLDENLIIQTFLAKDCIFPFSAMEVRVTPDDGVAYRSCFEWLE